MPRRSLALALFITLAAAPEAANAYHGPGGRGWHPRSYYGYGYRPPPRHSYRPFFGFGYTAPRAYYGDYGYGRGGYRSRSIYPDGIYPNDRRGDGR